MCTISAINIMLNESKILDLSKPVYIPQRALLLCVPHHIMCFNHITNTPPVTIHGSMQCSLSVTCHGDRNEEPRQYSGWSHNTGTFDSLLYIIIYSSPGGSAAFGPIVGSVVSGLCVCVCVCVCLF